MIFEYKCRRCRMITVQEHEPDKFGLASHLNRAEEQLVVKGEGITSHPYPNWIFHNDCPHILEDVPGYFAPQITPVRGTGIADLIGGRQ